MGSTHPSNVIIPRTACKGGRTAKDACVDAHLDRQVAELERPYKEHGMRGLCEHLKRSAGIDARPLGG
ncbi:unnamed protein product [Pylaiella littoralis]